MSLAEVSEKTLVDMFKSTIKTTYSSPGNKPGLIAVSGLNYTVNPKKGELTANTYNTSVSAVEVLFDDENVVNYYKNN